MWLLISGARVNIRRVALSRAGKARDPLDLHLLNPTRRDFLLRCCQGASGALLPASLRDFAVASHYPFNLPAEFSSEGEFRLHPHYRTPRSVDTTLLKTQAGLDDFVNEKYQDQLATILGEWSAGLLRSPGEMHPIERVLSPDFSGSSLHPVEAQHVRSGSVEVNRNTFLFQR